MRSDQLDLLMTVSAPTVHPDGRWACVAATRPSFAADSYVGQLWYVPCSPGGPQRITRGFCDSAPQYSHDGTLIAFLRSLPGEPRQLYIVAGEGGEPMRITDQKRGVGAFAFSPDSSKIVFVSRVPEDGRYGTVDGISAGQEDPRHITHLKFHSNGLGFTADQRAQLFVIDVPDVYAEPVVMPRGRAAQSERDTCDQTREVPPATRITNDDTDWGAPIFSADGKYVIAHASRHAGHDHDLVSLLWRMPIAGGDPELLTQQPTEATTFAYYAPVLSRDGGTIFALGHNLGPDGMDFVAKGIGVFALNADGGVPRRLTDEAIELTAGLAPCGKNSVLAIQGRRGASVVLRVGLDGTASTVVDGPIVVTACAEIPGSDDVMVVCATEDSLSDVVLVSSGRITALTDFSKPLREQTMVIKPQEINASAPDGYPVHGWLYLPAGAGPHPVVLNIHGGPFSNYSGSLFDEPQVLVEAGYAVVMCNPRGSATYGYEHGKVIQGDFGNVDMNDILAFLDHCVGSHPELDASRMAVIGGSYGGFMTAWIIGHDHRFKAAVVERGFLDPESFTGASDIGWFFQGQYNGTNLAQQRAQSPMTFLDEVRTPTLVVHSEQDYRCPIGQAYRYYTELKLRGVDTELLVFPGENHELSRSGTPWHRRVRFDKIIGWLDAKLAVNHAAEVPDLGHHSRQAQGLKDLWESPFSPPTPTLPNGK